MAERFEWLEAAAVVVVVAVGSITAIIIANTVIISTL